MKVETQKACLQCEKCINDCVAENLTIEGTGVRAKRDCIFCGHCVAICPIKAVSIPTYDMEDVDEIDSEVSRLNSSELLFAIKQRRSIRNFLANQIEREIIESIIQAGRYTATGKNAQDCCFIFVQDNLSLLKEKVWIAVERTVLLGNEVPGDSILLPGYKRFIEMRNREKPVDYLFRNAPSFLFVAAENPISAALASQNMELMAVSQGLGVMYNGYLVRTANAFPEIGKWLSSYGKRFYICMLIGYPNVKYARTAPRKPAEIIWL